MTARIRQQSTVSLAPWIRARLRYALALTIDATLFWLVVQIFITNQSISWLASVAVFALLSLQNAFVTPLMLSPLARLPGWLFVILSFILSGIVTFFADAVVLDWHIKSFTHAVFIAIILGTISFSTSTILSFNDDRAWSRYALRPLRIRFAEEFDLTVTEPGLALLEIDGLSIDTLEYAIERGYAPNLGRWIAHGTHRLTRWECDLSSQTGASQAGILLGSNHNLPAYRWYDRALGRVVVSTRDAALLEKRISSGVGLLSDGGASRGNMFAGDAPDSLFTFSTLRVRSSSRMLEYYALFANAYNLARTIALFLADIVRELIAAIWQIIRRERPRVHRFGIYPLVRAATTSLLRELSTFTVAGDMMRGVPAMYTTYIAYDEVAHHSGVRRGDTMRVLRDIDRDIGRLEREAARAKRPYHLIVLSDHGQSQGATFLQLTGKSLPKVVTDLIAGNEDNAVRADVQTHLSSDEGWQLLSALISDVTETSIRIPPALRDRVQQRLDKADVSVDGDRSPHLTQRRTATTKDDVIVLASGNLGLVSFPFSDTRLTIDEISGNFPALLPGLILHKGIGFVMVQNGDRQALVLGVGGSHNLDTGEIIGVDPIASYPDHAAQHLLRTHRFDNVPDILIGGSVDPETQDVHAFEELVGSHGGLGGAQTRPFLLYPSNLALETDDIVGAEAVYRQLMSWRFGKKGGP